MLRSSMPGVREARVCRRSIENVVRSRSGAVAHDWLENKRTQCSLRSLARRRPRLSFCKCTHHATLV